MRLVFCGYVAVTTSGRCSRFIARDEADPEMVKRGWHPVFRAEKEPNDG